MNVPTRRLALLAACAIALAAAAPGNAAISTFATSQGDVFGAGSSHSSDSASDADADGDGRSSAEAVSAYGSARSEVDLTGSDPEDGRFGALKARASFSMTVWEGDSGTGYSQARAELEDVLTVSAPTTVTLTGTLTGTLSAGSSAFGPASVSAAFRSSFSRDWLPDENRGEDGGERKHLGGVSRRYGASGSVDETFSVDVELPSGTVYFSAALEALVSLNNWGGYSIGGSVEFADTARFQIEVPSGVTVTSASGYLPIVGGDALPEPSLPDLRPHPPSIAVTPSAAAAGSTVDVLAGVENAGSADTSVDFDDRVYFSSDDVLDAGDTPLGAMTLVAPIRAGLVYAPAVAVTVPSVAPGDYFLVVSVDDAGTVAESDETNNTYALPFRVLPPPDLVPYGAEIEAIPAATYANLNVIVYDVPQNAGGSDVLVDFVDRVYLSPDATLDASDTAVAEVTLVAPLRAGVRFRVSTFIRPFPAVPPGDYYLLFSVDDDDVVSEADETNNVFALPYTVLAPEVSLNADFSIAEGDAAGGGAAAFLVQISPFAALPATVTYATEDGTATAGEDYTAVSGTLTFAPGEFTKTILVPRVGDTVCEGDETYVLRLSFPTNAQLGRSAAEATIVDDDGECISEFLAAGGALATGSGATPSNPLATRVQTPVAGTVSIHEPRPGDPPPPTAYALFAAEATITAPAASVTSPLLLTFWLDGSLLPSPDPADVVVFRNGVAVPPCTAASAAAPDPCVAAAALTGDDVELVVRTSAASTWTFGRPIVERGRVTGPGFVVRSDGRSVEGELRLGSYKAARLHALNVGEDERSAWFAGWLRDGRTFVGYVEDNGEPGRDDVFRLWVGGELVSDSRRGNVQFHRR